jgi:hypothetical protein
MLANPAPHWRDTMRLNLRNRDLEVFTPSELAELSELLFVWKNAVDNRLRDLRSASKEEESE